MRYISVEHSGSYARKSMENKRTYSKDSKDFRAAFIQREWKDSERLFLRGKEVEKPALEVKQQRHLHLCGLGCFRRYARRCMQFNAEWTFDSIELK